MFFESTHRSDASNFNDSSRQSRRNLNPSYPPRSTEGDGDDSDVVGFWERVPAAVSSSALPCQRSLHAAAVWQDMLLIFGGYDGQHRVNDLYAYHFITHHWQLLRSASGVTTPPCPRDRHVAVVYDNCLYIFGGFDGLARVSDLHAYDLEINEWHQILPNRGSAEPPTPRHSHAAVVYRSSMYIFGGYDGSYRNDFHQFHFPTCKWSEVQSSGESPRARYRGTCVVAADSQMILHGGHDGNKHLQDTHVFDFASSSWSLLRTEGPTPSPRDSHVAVMFGKSMFLYGGSTGSAMGDFHELKFSENGTAKWSPVPLLTTSSTRSSSSSNLEELSELSTHRSSVTNAAAASGASSSGGRSRSLLTPPALPPRKGLRRSAGSPSQGTSLIHGGMSPLDSVAVSPGARFCHVGVVYDGAFYIFGGYDGSFRLNDFLMYRIQEEEPVTSTLIMDLKKYVNCDLLSDIKFIVEGRPVFAHKILCLRCPFLYNMLTGEYMESRASEIPINNVKYSTFLSLLEYLYTDEVTTVITTDTAMDLFQAADMFGIDRLKKMCEQEMLNAITVDTAAQILYAADQRNAQNLRDRCLNYVLTHFDEVSRTAGFEEMGRINVDLVFEILRKR